MTKTKVGILMGSASDLTAMEAAADTLEGLGVGCEMRVLSAHRTPEEVHEYVSAAPGRGIRVLIAGAGMSAHLAGVVGAATDLPVIGVPMDASSLGGLDALLSTVQMPSGIPVATVAIGATGAKNAAYLAAQILALSDPELADRVTADRAASAEKVQSQNQALQAGL